MGVVIGVKIVEVGSLLDGGEVESSHTRRAYIGTVLEVKTDSVGRHLPAC
jgi:hypothetical protein